MLNTDALSFNTVLCCVVLHCPPQGEDSTLQQFQFRLKECLDLAPDRCRREEKVFFANVMTQVR